MTGEALILGGGIVGEAAFISLVRHHAANTIEIVKLPRDCRPARAVARSSTAEHAWILGISSYLRSALESIVY
jgi:hypothetical protein